MHVDDLIFGKIIVDGRTYTKDVIISDNQVKKRHKGPSRALKAHFGHTPLTAAENIPWECETLVIGTGIYGRLPVSDDVSTKAQELGVKLLVKTTPEAVKHINDLDTNLVLHITC